MKVDLDILIKTCNALDVDIERFYSDYIKTTHKVYKKNEFSILKKYKSLNSVGKEKAETYIDDLLVNPQYTVPDNADSVHEERRLGTPSLDEAMEIQKQHSPLRTDRLGHDNIIHKAAFGGGVWDEKPGK